MIAVEGIISFLKDYKELFNLTVTKTLYYNFHLLHHIQFVDLCPKDCNVEFILQYFAGIFNQVVVT